MGLHDDLAEWAATRENWQRAVISQLCAGATIDIEALANHVADEDHPDVDPIEPADIPGGTQAWPQVRVASLGHVSGVDALIEGQALTFAADGITVIYGDNGSGNVNGG